MVKNYNNSKIYKIEPIIDHKEGDIYIGSTTKYYLSQRMDKHRYDYKYWKISEGTSPFTSSFKLFEKYGIEYCQILLLESCPCDTINEIRTREGYYIKTLKCVNKNAAGRGQKEYYNDNKEQIKIYNKEYYNDNIEKIKKKL